MKKIIWVFFLSFACLFFISGIVKANGDGVVGFGPPEAPPLCIDPSLGGNMPAVKEDVPNFISSGANKGLVPCGQTCIIQVKNKEGVPRQIGVTCGKCLKTTLGPNGTFEYGEKNCALNDPPASILACPCQLGHFFVMGVRIYTFIIKYVAFPLVGLFVVLGGVLILLSGMNQGWYNTGKNMLIGTAIALGIILGSWLIVDIVLRAIGYPLSWWIF